MTTRQLQTWPRLGTADRADTLSRRGRRVRQAGDLGRRFARRITGGLWIGTPFFRTRLAVRVMNVFIFGSDSVTTQGVAIVLRQAPTITMQTRELDPRQGRSIEA